ncbi:MAG TPA: TIGR03618 family F420-dependent PPOX class oxidoreductase [Methylomirabilota bacterium]|nr:TIGR03618 family F420-dependent PPOX class oxidoreductase [Methylomirabilota bacterium]
MTDPALTVGTVLTDDLRAWLTGKLRFPVLAVLSTSGAPVQSVMWFDIDPDHVDTILMNTRVERAKARQLRRDPRVSLCFEDELRWVALQGRVELDDDSERALADIKALARRYGSDPAQFDGQQRVTMRMRVEKVIRHD